MSYYIGPGSWINFCCVPKNQPVEKSQPRICKDAKGYRFRRNLERKVIFGCGFCCCFVFFGDLVIVSTVD